MRTLAVTAISVLTVLGAAAWAQTAPPADLKGRYQAMDKNGDGRVDREEFYRVVVESFYFRDKNRSGYLTLEELTEASPEAFKAANRKADGKLSLPEYVNALFRDFEAADLDKDGTLSFEEFEIYVKSARK